MPPPEGGRLEGGATGQSLQIQPREARRNDEPIFEPTTPEEALQEDLREARRTHTGINETIALHCGVRPETVYSWRDRAHVWSLRQAFETSCATGGKHFIGLFIRGAAQARTLGGQGALASGVAELVEQTALLNRLTAEALEDGTLTDEERLRLFEKLERIGAELAATRARLGA